MKVRDRKKLATLIVVQELSHREVAEAAGWKSHSYVGRLLRGEVTTLKAEPAVRIAKLLGVQLEDIFLTQMDGNPVRNGRRTRPSVNRSRADQVVGGRGENLEHRTSRAGRPTERAAS